MYPIVFIIVIRDRFFKLIKYNNFRKEQNGNLIISLLTDHDG